MKRIAGVFLFLVFSAISPFANAVSFYVDSAFTSRLMEAQSAILSDQFDLADSISQRLIVDYPLDPAGRLSLAASQLARMTDAEANLYGKQFTVSLDSITNQCQQLILTADAPRKAWLCLFLGHAQAYRALYESKFGSSYKAVRMGLATNDSYQAGLASDSSLYDLYFGLGSYHYWKSVKAGVFRWLGIFHNDIDLGIRELQLAVDSSLLSRNVALASLCWVWLDRERFDSVEQISAELTSIYPTGKSFLWPQARAEFDSKRYAQAIKSYGRIRALLEKNPGNHFNVVECDYYIARSFEKSGEESEAIRCAAQFPMYEKYVSAEVRHRQADKISYLKRLAARAVTTVSTER